MLFIIAALLTAFATVGNGCSCATFDHLQNSFCPRGRNNLFIAVVTIRGSKETRIYSDGSEEVFDPSARFNGTGSNLMEYVRWYWLRNERRERADSIRFEIHVDEALNSISTTALGERRQYLYTSISSASCGIYLATNRSYLITGRIDPSGGLHSGLCDLHIDLLSLSTEEKRSIIKYVTSAAFGCDAGCRLAVCNSPFLVWDCLFPEPMECVGESGDIHSYSSFPSRLCLPSSENSCQWTDVTPAKRF